MEVINNEYYVSFEIANLLKKAGFDWDTYNAYNKDGVFTDKNRSMITWNHFSEYYSAPTLEVAQRWLRKVKGYYVVWEFNMNINSLGQELYDFTDISVYIFVESKQGNICKNRLKENYKTIEEAQEAGIKKALIIYEKENINKTRENGNLQQV